MRSQKPSLKLKTQIMESKPLAQLVEQCSTKRFNVCGVKVNIGRDSSQSKRGSYMFPRTSKLQCEGGCGRGSIMLTANKRNTFMGECINSQQCIGITKPQQLHTEPEDVWMHLLKRKTQKLNRRDNVVEQDMSKDAIDIRSIAYGQTTHMSEGNQNRNYMSQKPVKSKELTGSGSTIEESTEIFAQLNAKSKLNRMAQRCILLQQKIVTLEHMLIQAKAGNKVELQQLQKKLQSDSTQLQHSLSGKLSHFSPRLIEVNENSKLAPINMNTRCSEEIQQMRALVKRNQELLEQYKQSQAKAVQLENAKDQVKTLKQTLRERDKQLQALEHQHSRIQCHYEAANERNRQLEIELGRIKIRAGQVQYEVMCKKQLQAKLTERNRVLAESEIQVTKLSNENRQYKTKLDTIAQNFYRNIIQEKYLINNLTQMTEEASETRLKVTEAIQSLVSQVQGKELLEEKITFLKHLFVKNQDMLNGIIAEFKAQLGVLHNESDSYRNAVEELEVEKQRLSQVKQQQQMIFLQSQQHFGKYLQEMQRINVKNCISCNQFVGYCTQIDRILTQLADTILK